MTSMEEPIKSSNKMSILGLLRNVNILLTQENPELIMQKKMSKIVQEMQGL